MQLQVEDGTRTVVYIKMCFDAAVFFDVAVLIWFLYSVRFLHV